MFGCAGAVGERHWLDSGHLFPGICWTQAIQVPPIYLAEMASQCTEEIHSPNSPLTFPPFLFRSESCPFFSSSELSRAWWWRWWRWWRSLFWLFWLSLCLIKSLLQFVDIKITDIIYHYGYHYYCGYGYHYHSLLLLSSYNIQGMMIITSDTRYSILIHYDYYDYRYMTTIGSQGARHHSAEETRQDRRRDRGLPGDPGGAAGCNGGVPLIW